MDPVSQYFIADKLRGIPLVSAGLKREHQKKQEHRNTRNHSFPLEEKVITSRSQSRQVSSFTSTTNTENTQAHQTSGSLSRRKPSRIISTTTRRPILFTTSTTTSVKPQTTSTSSTTTTTTTTRRPNNRVKPVKNIIDAKPIKAVKLAKLLRPATILRPNSQIINSPASSDQLTRVIPKTFANENLTSTNSRWSSTLSTGLPDLQRRTPQNVLSPPRFINRRDESHAGENWILFNRPDGRFSAFETLVLVSNILIVSTVIVVILANWFRSFKKKRKCNKTNADPEAKLPGQKKEISNESEERDSKSPVSQLVMSRNSDMLVRTPVSSRISSSSELITKEAQIERHKIPSSMSKEKLNEVAGGNLKVGSAQKITSETISGATSVANKAMAIVQPTENNNKSAVKSTLQSPIVDSEQKKQNKQENLIKQPANKTVSDISGSSDAAGVKQQVVKSEAERVGMLEDLFKGSAPELSSDAVATSKLETEKGMQQVNLDKLNKSGSRESLESIELPKALVDSIKQTEPSAGITIVDPAPSPNLLLGEVETADADEQASKKKNQPVASVAKEINKSEPKSSSKNQPSSKAQTTPIVVASDSSKKLQEEHTMVQIVDQKEAAVKNHQVVVNKLDKRKTNLEIVDLRDESVIGRLRDSTESSAKKHEEEGTSGKGEEIGSGWISMDGVAVVQGVNTQVPLPINQQHLPVMSPSEIIESKFHVDYKSRKHKDSIDSKSEEHAMIHSIEDELEQGNKMRNRKYFVYIVHDGHFTAKKECIARIELPPKRRITLAEMRQLIANSQDISLTSLRRNRFKFVTETYRLLNENEDAAVLHQVYPTQGVFLKLNIPEQEGLMGGYSTNKAARARISSLGGSSLGAATISSRRRANAGRATRFTTGADQLLPAIEVDYANSQENQPKLANSDSTVQYGRTRASSVSRTRAAALPASRTRPPTRAKSSVQEGVTRRRERDKLPAIGRSPVVRKKELEQPSSSKPSYGRAKEPEQQQPIGAQMLSGAKRLFRSTFNQK